MAAPAMNPAYLVDPSLYGDQQAIDQQRQLAQLLMTQGLTSPQGTEAIGGVAIRRSPMEGLARMAQLLSGQSMQRDANTASQDLIGRQGATMARLLGGVGPAQAPDAGMGGGQQGMPAAAPGGGGMVPRIPGDNTGMLSLMALQDPNEYAKMIASANAPTDLDKQLTAQGIQPGDPRWAAAHAAAQAKGNHIPLEEVKQGNTALDPLTRKPVAFGVKVADAAQPNWDGSGRMTSISTVPGGPEAIASAKAAEGAGESQNAMMSVDMPDGTKQNMTRAQAVAYANGKQKPADFSSWKGDPQVLRQKLIDSGDYQGLGSLDSQVASGKLPGFGSGQSTAAAEEAKTGAADVVKRNQAILADANAAPQDIKTLQEMAALSKTSNFGPGASNVAKWKAFAAQVPGIGLIADPQTLEQQQTNVSVMKKYMSNMAGRMSGSSGTGTDARLQNAIDSLPNDTAPDAAIQQVVPMLLAQRTARIDEARLRSKLGNDSAAIQKFETEWRGAYDPLAYEATLATRGMTPADAAKYVGAHFTPAQAAEIAKSRAQLRALGVQF